MSNISILQNQSVLTMSSRDLANLVEVPHDSVLKTIRGLADKGVVSPNETRYQNEQNKQFYPEFKIGKRDVFVIASGYSVAMRAKIIDRWLELEESQKQPQFSIPQTLPEALRLAADLADQLAIAAPKVAVYELLADRKGDVSTTIVAKELGTTSIKLNRFLRDSGVKWLNADLPKAGYEKWFNVVTMDVNGDTRHQCLITPMGQLNIAELWSSRNV